MTTPRRLGDDLARIRRDANDNLRDSVWMVLGKEVEAADREQWLDVAWLLEAFAAITAERDELRKRLDEGCPVCNAVGESFR